MSPNEGRSVKGISDIFPLRLSYYRDPDFDDDEELDSPPRVRVHRPVVTSDWVTLNVGGKIFQTSRSTLLADKSSMLAHLISSPISSSTDPGGAILIDRDPKYFGPILNYLRCGKLIIDEGISLAGVYEEAKFFQVQRVMELCHPRNRPDLTRQQIILNRSIPLTGLRLMRVDFSKLHFVEAHFDESNVDYANFQEAHLVKCFFRKTKGQRVNFRRAKLNEAYLMGAILPYSSFSFATVQYANFRDANLVGTRWRGANCQGALFQKADLRGADFSLAHLLHSKFQDSDLRGVKFGDTTLQGVHFSRADLRGAQLDWASAREKHVFTHAKVTQTEFDAIPLEPNIKNEFQLEVVPDVIGPEEDEETRAKEGDTDTETEYTEN